MVEQFTKARIEYLEEQRSKLESIQSLISMSIQDVEQELSMYKSLNIIYNKRSNPDVAISFDDIIIPALNELKPVVEIKKISKENKKIRQKPVRQTIIHTTSTNIPLNRGKFVDQKKIGSLIRDHFKNKDYFTIENAQDWLLEKYPDIQNYWADMNKGIRNVMARVKAFENIERGKYKITN
jgi:hypothetical protein